MLTALRPEVLDGEGGLRAAVERVCAEWSRRTGTPCAVHVTGDVLRLHPEVDVMLLRTTQELLSNVRKHAQAKHVTVTLSYIGDVVALDVRDDGVGFPPDAVTPGFGLRGMRERAAQFSGTMEVESAPGEGTTVSVTVPACRTETYPVPAHLLGAPPGVATGGAG